MAGSGGGAVLWLLCSIAIVLVDTKVYVFEGNPYEGGKLRTQGNDLTDFKQLPLYTSMYYPVEAGEYVPIVFIPGLQGTVLPDFYSDTLEHLASHGYVVVSMNTILPSLSYDNSKRNSVHKVEILAKRVYEEIQWMRVNLVNVILSTFVANVTVDWSTLGFGAHSAGSNIILQLLKNKTIEAKAVAFMEPFSENFKAPLGYSIPALAYGTQLCEEPPQCCIPGIDYRHFYDELECPKVMMNVSDYGHCAILNDLGWASCRDINFCRTNPTVDRDFYREFVAGVMSALFGTYLQGNNQLLSYLTNPDHIPVSMGAFEVDVNCN